MHPTDLEHTRHRTSVSRNGQTRSQYAGLPKRVFDIVFVLLVAPFVLTVVVMLAILVRLDGGPAFYMQDRVGRGGRRFRMYKLRTMVTDADARLARHLARDERAAAEWERSQKLTHDPRITRVGAILRCTSLDELPQFLNVLLGDMSIVGPRPFTTEQEAAYRATGGTAYFRLRPGLTGPWQVSDRHRSRFIDRRAHDDAYAEALSLAFDLILIFRTVLTMISRSGR